MGAVVAERRRRRRASRLRLVFDGRPDEAPDYVEAVLELVEQHGQALETWWRSATRGRLELRWEVWGSGHHVRLHRSSGALHCVVQRSLESTWTADHPAAQALHDLTRALDAVSEDLRRVPPVLT